MDKSIIFLNPLELGDDLYSKLIVKDGNSGLLDRLKGFLYLEYHAKSGCYIMPHTDHNVQMLADGTSDLALLNTCYMTKAKIKTGHVRIDKENGNVDRRKALIKVTLRIFPLVHEGKTYALIKFRYNRRVYQELKTLPYVKFSKTYRRFISQLNEQTLQKLLKDLTPFCQIQLNSKIEINNINLQKKLWEQSYTGTIYKSCPDIYLEKMKLRNNSINTIKTYHSMLMKFINHFDQEMEIINHFTEKEINTYHREMIQTKKYSFSYVNQSLNAIKYYYNEILNLGLTTELLERPKKMKPLPKVLTKAEIAGVIRVTENEKHKIMIFLTYSSGVRIGELLELRKEDLDFERMLIHVQDAKGRKDRYTIFSKKAAIMLNTYLQHYSPGEYLFEGQYGGKYSSSSVNKFWRRALLQAGVQYPFTFHSLRHTFATHLLENGTDIRYIQELLGHSSSKTTEIYTHIATKYLCNIKSPGDLIKI